MSLHNRINISGFLFTPIWICIFWLNCLFLAQVLEIYMRFGTRTNLFYFGSYNVGSLAGGILCSFEQVCLKFISEATGQKWEKSLWLLCLTLCILSEAGISFYRGYLGPITIGTIGSDTFASSGLMNLITVEGPIFTGLFGLILPITQVYLGSVVWREFIIPISFSFFYYVNYGLKIFLLKIYHISYEILKRNMVN